MAVTTHVAIIFVCCSQPKGTGKKKVSNCAEVEEIRNIRTAFITLIKL